MRFLFRKLYADLVADDGTVAIAYLAWLEVGALRRAYAGLEVYAPDGRRETWAGSAPAAEPGPAPERGPWRVRLPLEAGAFALDYDVAAGAWEPRPPAPCEGLRWAVRVARGEAVGRWEGRPGPPDLHGLGYADWVEMRRPPRGLGIRSVEWGRVHLPDSTVVFTRVRVGSGGVWERAGRWTAADFIERDRFGLRQKGSSWQLALCGLAGNVTDALTLRPERTLHAGLAFDDRRLASPVLRALVRVLAGPTRETRWLSRAAPAGNVAQLGGRALHEAVEFGTSARWADA